MNYGSAERIELLTDAGAAISLAGAVGYALMQLAPGVGLDASVSALSFLGCFYGLRTVQPEEQTFSLRDLASTQRCEADPGVLELTESDRWQLDPTDERELVLDRELAHFGPGSRVVRLFEPYAMPTAGDLNARIEQHLMEFPQPTPPDASQELYDALAQLRRSLS